VKLIIVFITFTAPTSKMPSICPKSNVLEYHKAVLCLNLVTTIEKKFTFAFELLRSQNIIDDKYTDFYRYTIAQCEQLLRLVEFLRLLKGFYGRQVYDLFNGKYYRFEKDLNKLPTKQVVVERLEEEDLPGLTFYALTNEYFQDSRRVLDDFYCDDMQHFEEADEKNRYFRRAVSAMDIAYESIDRYNSL
jgi:hypothetical protein